MVRRLFIFGFGFSGAALERRLAPNGWDVVGTTRSSPRDYDGADAVLIAEEAGAAVSDAFGRPLDFNTPDAQAFGVLATAPGIHAAAVARLADRAKEAIGRA